MSWIRIQGFGDVGLRGFGGVSRDPEFRLQVLWARVGAWGNG